MVSLAVRVSVLMAGLGAVYLQLFVPPATPIVRLASDHYKFMEGATRILRGDVLYRDFFSFLPPGTYLLYEGLIAIVGVRLWLPHVLLLLIGLTVTWSLLALADGALSRPWGTGWRASWRATRRHDRS